MSKYMEISLLTLADLDRKDEWTMTCLIFDQDAFPQMESAMAVAISEGNIWHLIIVGDTASDVEDRILDIISSVTSRIVMTSSVTSYDFAEILSLASITPEGEGSHRKVVYVYDGDRPDRYLIGEKLAASAQKLDL